MLRAFIRAKSVLLWILAIVLLTMAPGPAHSENHNTTLSAPEISSDVSGRTIVTMAARGDLPGVFTVALNTSADGAVTGGEWALIVSYTAVVAADGQVHIGGTDDEGAAAEALVQRGTLKGDVAQGGTLTRNADGSVSSLNGILLSVKGGTLEYSGVAGGAGNVNGWNLADAETSNGVLALSF